MPFPNGPSELELLGDQQAERPRRPRSRRRVCERRSGPPGASTAADVRREGGAEGIHVLRRAISMPGGGAVAAEALEVLGAGFEAGDAGRSRGCCGPSRGRRPSPSSAITIAGPPVALDHARGDDPDDAGVPALPGDHQTPAPARPRRAARAARLGRRAEPRARSPAARVLARFSSSAISAARVRVRRSASARPPASAR